MRICNIVSFRWGLDFQKIADDSLVQSQWGDYHVLFDQRSHSYRKLSQIRRFCCGINILQFISWRWIRRFNPCAIHSNWAEWHSKTRRDWFPLLPKGSGHEGCSVNVYYNAKLYWGRIWSGWKGRPKLHPQNQLQSFGLLQPDQHVPIWHSHLHSPFQLGFHLDDPQHALRMAAPTNMLKGESASQNSLQTFVQCDLPSSSEWRFTFLYPSVARWSRHCFLQRIDSFRDSGSFVDRSWQWTFK